MAYPPTLEPIALFFRWATRESSTSASLLDTFSCVFQGVLPYGAQMLVALSAATELGFSLTAFQIIPFIFYPFLLLVSSLLFIFVFPERKVDRL